MFIFFTFHIMLYNIDNSIDCLKYFDLRFLKPRFRLVHKNIVASTQQSENKWI